MINILLLTKRERMAHRRHNMEMGLAGSIPSYLQGRHVRNNLSMRHVSSAFMLQVN